MRSGRLRYVPPALFGGATVGLLAFFTWMLYKDCQEKGEAPPWGSVRKLVFGAAPLSG